MIYFDANASVPVRESAKQAIQRALLLDGNPSSPHGTDEKFGNFSILLGKMLQWRWAAKKRT